MKTPFVDLKAQYRALQPAIQKRIDQVLEHGQYIMGPEVEECEQLLAEFSGAKHAITCSSGTDAAIMAFMALGIGPDDEVILPALSYIATAETVLLVGATPVYVDIEPDTFNMDANQLEQAISNKTKAIVPVSLYGQTPDMDAINKIAKKHNVYVIEDAAQSFGGTYNGQKSANLSDMGCTSFFPAKPLGCYGDGGAIFTNNDDWAAALKQIRFHGQSDRNYHPRIGINGRMDTLQCAILIPKLERFSWELGQRQRVAEGYRERLMTLEPTGLRLPVIRPDRTSAWAQYTIRVPNREKFQSNMTAQGIPTAIYYPMPMPDQPAYQKIGRVYDINNCRKVCQEVISLPMYPDMSPEVLDMVTDAVHASLA